MSTNRRKTKAISLPIVNKNKKFPITIFQKMDFIENYMCLSLSLKSNGEKLNCDWITSYLLSLISVPFINAL